MRFGVSKGDILTLKTVVQRGKRAYIEIGNKLLLAEIPEDLKPGEKMVVTQVFTERLVLKPYSKLFQNLALSEMLKNVNLPENKMALKLLQGFLIHNIPPRPEKLRELYNQIMDNPHRETWMNLTLALLHRKQNIYISPIQGFQELFSSFLKLSTKDELLLPLNNSGAFFMAQKDSSGQFYFFIYMPLKHLEDIFCKGWMSDNGKKGELNILHMPFIDSEYFFELKNSIQKEISEIQIYIKPLFKSSMRQVDGIF